MAVSRWLRRVWNHSAINTRGAIFQVDRQALYRDIEFLQNGDLGKLMPMICLKTFGHEFICRRGFYQKYDIILFGSRYAWPGFFVTG